MASRFYEFVNRLISGTVAKATEVNAQFDALEVGLDAVSLECNRAVKLPVGDQDTNQVLVGAAADREGFLIGFDASGLLTMSASFATDWSMGGFRLRDVPTAIAGDEPVTLTQMTSYSAGLTGLPAIAGQDGPLYTDGATVSWLAVERLVPTGGSEGQHLEWVSGVPTWDDVQDVESNTFGYGFAGPNIILGDATATSATLDLRSAAGAQAYDVRVRSTGGTNGTPGLGTLTITAAKTVFAGAVGFSAEYDNGNSGASITINQSNGPAQKLTLNHATPTVTLAAGTVVGRVVLKVVQVAGGSVITWAGIAATEAVGNAFPVIASGAAGVTFIDLYWDGTLWWMSGNAWD